MNSPFECGGQFMCDHYSDQLCRPVANQFRLSTKLISFATNQLIKKKATWLFQNCVYTPNLNNNFLWHIQQTIGAMNQWPEKIEKSILRGHLTYSDRLKICTFLCE